MVIVKVRNNELEIDVEEELRQYDWTRPQWEGDRLQAASPFRHERNPSFFVLTQKSKGYPAGTWSDQGADDPNWRSGGLVKLLSFLRNETYEETVEYLLYRYGGNSTGEELTLLKRTYELTKPITSIRSDILDGLAKDYEYLKGRGISEEVQARAGILYDPMRKAVAIPWFTSDMRLANVKYRKTSDKVFWYAKNAVPIKNLLYGIERANKTTVICEAEIDAMSFEQAGIAAIAVGGSSFNSTKRDVIRRSGIETLIIATDQDKAGRKLRKEIENSLGYVVRVGHAYFIEGLKDANDQLRAYGEDSLREVVDSANFRDQLNVNLNNIR